MLSVTYSLFSRLVPSEGIPRRDTAAFYTVAILHVAALAIMATSEVDLVAKAAYLLVWGLLNFLWLALLRRPVAPALISALRGWRRGSAFQPAADRSRPDQGPLRTVPPWYWPWPTRDADRSAARVRSQYWSINSLPHLIYTTWSIIRELHSRAVEASINVR